MSAPAPTSSTTETGGLRLRLVETAGRHRLDGAWWPHSRDLTRELVELVAGFPREHGRVTRVLFSRPDWDTAPRRVDLGIRVLKVGSFPNDDTNVVVVHTTNLERLTLLVVPSSYTQAQGEEALLAGSTPNNAHTGPELLLEVTDHHDAVAADQWVRTEDGDPTGSGGGSRG